MPKAKHPSKWKIETIHESDLEFSSYYEIPGTGGFYRISKSGNVISQRLRALKCWPGYWLKQKIVPSRKEKPYSRVNIYWENLPDTKSPTTLGRLLLLTFVGDPPTPDHLACHKNGITDDDRLGNLIWAKSLDVKKASIVRGTYASGEQSATCRFSNRQLDAIIELSNLGASVNLIARALSENQVRIRELLKFRMENRSKWEGLICPLTGNVKESSNE